MRYFFCIFLPPLAVLSTGRFIAFLLSILLTVCLWIPGMLYAFIVVNKYYERNEKQKQLRYDYPEYFNGEGLNTF